MAKYLKCQILLTKILQPFCLTTKNRKVKKINTKNFQAT